MKTDPLKEGLIAIHATGVGTVTAAMVAVRAEELAEINGREPGQASLSDLDQATRELTGEVGEDPGESALESMSEDERWDPVPGSAGTRARIAASADEDFEGRSDQERLVDEGVREAEHDQMLQAVRAAAEQQGPE